MFAGGVEVPQPDRFPPAVVNVRTGVGQRQRDGGGGGETEQRQGGRARLHGAERRGGERRDGRALRALTALYLGTVRRASPPAFYSSLVISPIDSAASSSNIEPIS